MADTIKIEGTNFIFATNFSGDPRRDPMYGSTTRKGNIIIPTMQLVDQLTDMGVNVKQTKNKNDDPEFVPTYYIPVTVRFRKKNGDPMPERFMPKIYHVVGNNEPVLLTEDSIGIIDDIDVLDVKVMFEPYCDERSGRWSHTVRVMYVTQDIGNDPFASQFVHKNDEPEELPFD